MTDLRWAAVEVNLEPAVGSEQRGFRPAIVISNEVFNQVTDNITILPLTSTPRRLYPSEVILTKGKAGQPLNSIIMTQHIRTISRQRIGKIFGYLRDAEIQHQVCQAIREHLELD
jgi:mRNA interferase MazF